MPSYVSIKCFTFYQKWIFYLWEILMLYARLFPKQVCMNFLQDLGPSLGISGWLQTLLCGSSAKWNCLLFYWSPSGPTFGTVQFVLPLLRCLGPLLGLVCPPFWDSLVPLVLSTVLGATQICKQSIISTAILLFVSLVVSL